MAIKLKSKSSTSIMSIDSVVEEYIAILQQEKTLSARKKELAEQIKKHAVEHGQKDSKGSSYLVSNGYVFGNNVRKSISLDNEKAMNYLKEKGFEEVATTLVRTINEQALEQLVSSGQIPTKDFESLCVIKETNAVLVKAETDAKDLAMPEVQVASRK